MKPDNERLKALDRRLNRGIYQDIFYILIQVGILCFWLIVIFFVLSAIL